MTLPDEPLTCAQGLVCEDCGEPASADDFIRAIGAVICPICLEGLVEQQPKEPVL